MNKVVKRLILFVISLLVVLGFSKVILTEYHAFNKHAVSSSQHAKVKAPNVTLTDFQGVADYIHKYKKLPSNYITKGDAGELGWYSGQDLWKFAKGKSIGGDIFTNSEGILPSAKGRIWYECDINYTGGHRNADRILYSNDGMILGTTDHYKTFKRYY